MGVECEACRDVAHAVEGVLDATPVLTVMHPAVGDPDAVGDLWDVVWDVIDEEVASWPLTRVFVELPLRDDMAAALDRHIVESNPSFVTADDVVRGALARSLVDDYVDLWVEAHS